MRRLVVVGVLVGCDHGSTARDAPQPPLPDAAARDTGIRVTRNNAPDVGVPVIFQSPDGTVLTTVMTDQAGIAITKIASHVTVTVLQPFRVSTYVDVPPGDQLTLAVFDGPRPARQVTVTIPADPDPSVTSYIVNHACGGVVGTVVNMPIDCGDANDLLVRSESIQGDVGMIFANDLAVVDNKMTVPGAFTACTNETFTITNTQSGTSALLAPAIIGAHGAMIFHNLELDLKPGSASATLPSLVQPGVDQAVFLNVNTKTFGLVHMVTSVQPTSATFALDLGAVVLPSFTAPDFDIASHRATWQESGGALTPDLTIARIPVARPLPDGGMAFWEWHVIAPYTAGELVLPVLPVGDFDFNPHPGDSANVFELALVQVPGGYDAMRANALSDVHGGGFGALPINVDMPAAPSRASAAYFNR